MISFSNCGQELQVERVELFIKTILNSSQDFDKSNSQRPSCLFLFHLLRLEVELFVHFKKLFVPSEELEFSSIVAGFTNEKGGQICHYLEGQILLLSPIEGTRV